MCFKYDVIIEFKFQLNSGVYTFSKFNYLNFSLIGLSIKSLMTGRRCYSNCIGRIYEKLFVITRCELSLSEFFFNNIFET